jgi:integrase
MASIRTRECKPDGRHSEPWTSYTVLFRIDGRQCSDAFETPREAADYKRLVERLGGAAAREIAKKHEKAPGGTITVTTLLRQHIDTLSGITKGTRQVYDRIHRQLSGYPMGALPIDGVSRQDVSAYIRGLEDSGLSGPSIQMRQQLLSSAFLRAVEDGVIARNPFRGAKIPRTERREKTFLTPGEFAQLLTAVPAEWQTLVTTLAGTGMRFGEATALKVSDLHLDDRPPTLTISRTWSFVSSGPRQTGAPKSERGRRTISLPPQIVDALRDHTRGMSSDDWVFTHDGHPITQQQMWQRWVRWVKASGIAKRPRIHDLRHSHVAWLLPHADLTTIQHRLGHASIKVTSDTYGHLLPEAQIKTAYAAELALSHAMPQIEA